MTMSASLSPYTSQVMSAACTTPVEVACTRCRRADYCDRPCQVAHWPAHKAPCKAAAKAAKGGSAAAGTGGAQG